jgi:penicillin-binding protein 1A
LWLFGRSPSVNELKSPKMAEASELYTSDGVQIGRYFNENRTPADYKHISPILLKTLVATEDVRFYKHHGIDFRAVFSALWSGIRGGGRGGGSTITQQLAKNLFKTRKDVSKGLLGNIPGLNTVISKTKEWITAIKLEGNFSKEDIITMYLNTVDFGSNTFGIKTAAKTYFNTSTDSLTASQSALLVGLLKAPSYYGPIQNPKNSLFRRNTVLQQMVKYGVITPKEYAVYSLDPIPKELYIEQAYEGAGTYLRGVVNNTLRVWCKKNGYDLYTDGLKIYTTIDSRIQHYGEEAVDEHMRTLQKRFDQHWEGQNPWVDEKNRELPHFIDSLVVRTDYYKAMRRKYGKKRVLLAKMMNRKRRMKVFTWKGEKDTSFSLIDSISYYKRFLHAGFMAMDPHTGYIKAWVGGLNYKYFKYDHVKQAKRQPGSTFKPFVYAAAFEEGGYSPCDRMVNKPVTINYVEKGENKSWSPHNADWIFDYDSITLRHAMAMSINSIAAQMTEKIGWSTVAKFAHRCGIMSPLAEVPSICLGSSDVNLYELVGAYSTFINEGVWNEPLYIIQIKDHNGKLIQEFKPKTHRAVSEETAFLMEDMLKGGLDEGGTSSNLWGYDLFKGGKETNEMGGKTGTSSNHSDGWFVGVSKDMVGGSWVGGEDRCIHFRSTEQGEGAKTALPIFGLFMEKVYADESLGIKHGHFPKPKVKITKSYNCHTPYKGKAKKDSSEEIIRSSPL